MELSTRIVCMEGITAAKQIYPNPSLFQLTMNSFYSLLSTRFVYASSVAYAYPSPEHDTLYLLLLYSRKKGCGHGTANIKNIKKYAAEHEFDIVVTVSKKSHTFNRAQNFYEKNGFVSYGSDQHQYYYKISNHDICLHETPNIKLSEYIDLDEACTIKDRLAIYLSLLAYYFRMRGSLPIAVEKMNKWIKMNSVEVY